jgi:inorganic phosphate transporter, PiT family
LLTLPGAAALGGVTYGVTRIFGDGAVGPVVVAVAGLALAGLAFARRVREPAPAPTG